MSRQFARRKSIPWWRFATSRRGSPNAGSSLSGTAGGRKGKSGFNRLGETMQTIWQDVRFALRQMVASPGFSLTATLSLALGIAATVAVFSVIYSAVLTPWPYKDFDRASSVWTIDK